MLKINCTLLRTIQPTIGDITSLLRRPLPVKSLSWTKSRMNNSTGGKATEELSNRSGQGINASKQLKNEAKKQAKMEKFAKKQQRQRESENEVSFSTSS